MKKQHRFAVGTDPGLAVAEHPRTLPDQGVARRDDVGHVIANVVNAAVGVALEKFGDRDTSPSGWMNSILVLGRVTNTVMTPCSGNGTAAEMSAPNTAP